MRQPLESGEVTIARGEESATYPARSLVVLAANPCPCGNFHGLSGGSCECTELQRSHYRRKLTGPILDRVDIWMEVRPQGRRRGADLRPGAGVLRRGASPGGRGQAAPGPPLPRLRVAPQRLVSRSGPASSGGRWSPTAQRLVDNELSDGRLTRRGLTRVQRLAWTVADCAGVPRPGEREAEIALRTALRRCARCAAGERGSSGVMSAARLRSAPRRHGAGGSGARGRAPRPGGPRAVRWSPATARRRPSCARSARQRALAKAQSATEARARRDAGASGWPRSTRSASSSRPPAAASASSSRATPSGRPALDELDDAITVRGLRRHAAGPVGARVRCRSTELATSVAVVGSRAASVYGVEVARAACASTSRGSGVPVVSGGGTRHRLRGPQRDAVAPAAPRSRCWPAASTGSTRQHNRPLLDHLAAEFAVVSEQPPGSRADATALPGAQPAHRRPDPRHRGRRGGPAQRRPQHRGVGRAA